MAANLGFSQPLKNIENETKIQKLQNQQYECEQEARIEIVIISILQYDNQMQNQVNKRKNRLQAIRQSLKTNPVLKTNTCAVQNKMQKRRKRRQSVVLDCTLTQSQKNILLEQEDVQVKTMVKFHEKYQMGEKIGEGSNGLVRKCYLRSTNELCAVKSMKMDEQQILFLKNNFKQIHALSHPNVIKYRNMYLDLKNKICFLVMDYDNSPDLLEFKDLEEDQVKVITQQLLDTVAYIHSQNICHRDVKPQNILYDRQNQKIKLIDFGISKNIQKRGNKKQMLTITGTLYYRAPEMFSGGGYDEKVDVWAVGITLYQLITHRTPFQSQYLSTTIENIQKGQIDFSDQIWNVYGKSAKDLVCRLLKKRSERFTAAQAKKHFWFNKKSSLPIDLSKSDSLNFKLGDPINPNFTKYVEDSDKILSNKKIPKIEESLKKKLLKNIISNISEDSDNSLIQIQSEGENQHDSPNGIPVQSPKKQDQKLQALRNGSEIQST